MAPGCKAVLRHPYFVVLLGEKEAGGGERKERRREVGEEEAGKGRRVLCKKETTFLYSLSSPSSLLSFEETCVYFHFLLVTCSLSVAEIISGKKIVEGGKEEIREGGKEGRRVKREGG